MARMRITHHSKGYAALLKSVEAQAEVRRRAERIAAAAGPGFHVEQSTPHTRARAAVVAPRGDSDNRLVRSIDAGRL